MTRSFHIFLVVALAAALLLKFVVAFGASGPVTWEDEYIYVANARAMLGGPEYYDPQYPPLYSLLMMPAMLFGEHFYPALLVINTLMSSLILVPLWLLARLMLSTRWALCLLFAASVLPLQFVYGQLILSENLFSTTFLFVVYFFLRSIEEKRARFALACGISIACCLLTRYFAVLLLPVLVAVWTWSALVSVRRREDSATAWVTHAAIVIAAAFATWSPWLIFGLTREWPLSHLIGMTSRSLAPGSPPAAGFFAWLTLYSFYWALMLAPVLALVALEAVRRLSLRKWPPATRERQLAILLSLFTAIFVLIAAHHSWKVPYNAEMPSRILGRYLVHLLPLWLLWAFVIAARIPQRGATSAYSPAELVISAIASCGLLALSYLGLIRGELIEVTPWFVMFRSGLDAQVFRAGFAIPIAVGSAGVVLLWVIWRATRFVRVILLAIVCGFYGYASFYGEGSIPTNGRHGREIARIAREHGLLESGRPHLDVVNALRRYKYRSSSITSSLKFWGLDPKMFTLVEADPGRSSSSVLILSDAPLSDGEGKLVHCYDCARLRPRPGWRRYYLYLRRSALAPD